MMVQNLFFYLMQKERKTKLISDHGTHGKDTGSPQVQAAILTTRIQELTQHLKDHPKDKSCRRGLIGLVGKRRRMLRYLEQNNPSAYSEVVSKLELRK